MIHENWGVKGGYFCIDCGLYFENKVQALIHHFETKHQNFELAGSGIKMVVKS